MANHGDTKAHTFFNVLRTMLTGGNFYRDEQALQLAVSAVDEFEKHILSGPHGAVVREEDVAPREDVTQRRAPNPGTAVVPASGPGIDYNRLAAALFEMQRQQQAQAEQPETQPDNEENEGNTE